MPNQPSIVLEPWKDGIVGLYMGGTIEEVLAALPELIGQSIGRTTLTEQLQTWGIKKRTYAEDLERVRARLVELFQEGYKDKHILKVLETEGTYIKKRALVRMRQELGLTRRVVYTDRKRQTAELEVQVRNLFHSGSIEGQGARLAHVTCKDAGIYASRFVLSP